MDRRTRLAAGTLAVAALVIYAGSARAEAGYSGKLLLTGGVANIEGAAGGGLTPWAVIAGYGTRDQVGGNAFYTGIRSEEYGLQVAGAQVGLWDRVELSFAEQRFDTREVGRELGLGSGFTFAQKVYGAKVKLFGDAVLEQDSALPQVSLGVQRKENNQSRVLDILNLRDRGTDYYLSATKLLLNQSLLLNGTLRWTEANQAGILGFGKPGPRIADDIAFRPTGRNYRAMVEGSVALLLGRNLAVGAEFRQKPDKLDFKEDYWYDVFMALAPSKNVTITLALVDLGNIVIKDKQRAGYLSVQVGF